ncbi:hypothetical protein [Falsiroseomonas tokyonensis]|uniref:Uncharacterized protein n=1 Tax=Falsiroseomonas tokyonensis TaxID=430521 RepID=A0ABV7BP40_9PROT|nr:hypothetical protein [Falsiroseomonas tokyonensis]MBU8536357.1 hypothetical protein [Falsiroseomonas tokyonensis]
MLGYYITSGICLALLIMIPIWSPGGAQPTYPFWVIALLALVVFVVPLVLRRRKREGAAQSGELAVRLEEVKD